MEDGMERKYPKGMKWTKQRKLVYEILLQSVEPMSAAQIFRRAMELYPEENFAVSTVYRILSAFEENGLVDRDLWPEDGTVFYGLNRGGHTHYAVCLECHKRIPLSVCPLGHMRAMADPGDFIVTGHKIELYGYCKDCRKGSFSSGSDKE